MRTSLVISLFCLVVQAAASRPAALSGRVVRLGSNTGVAHAQIVAAKVGGAITDYRNSVTDAEGRFSLPDLTPGSYRVYATREGYLRGEYGRRSVSGSGLPVTVDENQNPAPLLISLTPTGAIAGRVFDGGRPVRDAWVRALKARYSNGERNLSVVEWTQTDDRGEYRLFGLSPGLHYVVAVPLDRPRIEGNEIVTPVTATTANGNRTSIRSRLSLESIQAAAFEQAIYPPVYYPGTTDSAGALPIDVRGGETATGIDLAIAASHTFHVRGRVVVTATPAPDFIAALFSPDAGTVQRIPNAVVQSDGSFDFEHVPPGRYVLSVQTRVPPGPLMRDAVAVDIVDRDVEVPGVSLAPGVAVKGRLTIEGRPPSGNRLMTSVQLLSVVGFIRYSAIRFEPDGTFTIEDVMPREYRFQVLGPPGNWVKSARYGEDDALSGPLRIAAAQQGRELEVDLGEGAPALDAAVIDSERRPVPGVLVVAVPDAARRIQSRLYRSATSGSDGHARIEGLEPGEYTVFTSESLEAADWQDPAVLQRYGSRGTSLRIRKGESPAVTLRIQ